mmetsp:Transcript_9007/g.19859  ORF Transcript_9007/g.19859 Transcript_9007/m.19859 type:complete len:101 (+) Transcript_9007:628-930(+)
MNATLCFHGTPEANIDAILRAGLDPTRRAGQAYGAGEYFATKAQTSLGYCQGGGQMLVFAVLTDPKGLTMQTPDFLVVRENDHQIPLFVLFFEGFLHGAY